MFLIIFLLSFLLQTVLYNLGDRNVGLCFTGEAGRGGCYHGGQSHVELGGGLAGGLAVPRRHGRRGPRGEGEAAGAGVGVEVGEVLEVLLETEVVGGGHGPLVGAGGGGGEGLLGAAHRGHGAGAQPRRGPGPRRHRHEHLVLEHDPRLAEVVAGEHRGQASLRPGPRQPRVPAPAGWGRVVPVPAPGVGAGGGAAVDDEPVAVAGALRAAVAAVLGGGLEAAAGHAEAGQHHGLVGADGADLRVLNVAGADVVYPGSPHPDGSHAATGLLNHGRLIPWWLVFQISAEVQH